MKKIILISALMTLCFFLSALDGNVVKFNVEATQDIEADYMLVVLKIEKKDKDMSLALNKMNAVLKNIEDSLIGMGLQKNEIIVRKFNTVPDIKVWGTEYKIAGFIEIKVKQNEMLYKILKKINETDASVAIDKLSYIIDPERFDKIRADLIGIASKKSAVLKEAYEKSFLIKLKLNSILDNQSEWQLQLKAGFEEKDLSSYKFKDFSEGPSDSVMQSPLIKVNMILSFEYKIVE